MPSRIDQTLKQKQILVVEDNHLTLALLRTILRSEGYDVLEAVTARDGMEAAVRCRPDLIVMDIKLPDMSGFDATHALKAEAATRSIPVVITSAYGADADKEHLRKCGCDSYIPAPIQVSTFVDVIHSFIGSGSARRKDERDR
jgi:two-component system cell cycle response regulator DivK